MLDFLVSLFLVVAATMRTAAAQSQQIIPASNGGIKYTGSWSQVADPASCIPGQTIASTSTKGDMLQIQVTGASSLSVFGAVLPNRGAQFTISFAGQTSTADSTALQKNSTNAGCSLFLSIPTIDPASTNILTITHAGPGSGVTGGGVLSIDQFVFGAGGGSGGASASTSSSVTLSSVPATTLTATHTPTSTSSTASASSSAAAASASSSPSKSSNGPVIAGSVIATLAAVSILALLFMCYRRHRRNGSILPSGAGKPGTYRPQLWTKRFFSDSTMAADTSYSTNASGREEKFYSLNDRPGLGNGSGGIGEHGQWRVEPYTMPTIHQQLTRTPSSPRVPTRPEAAYQHEEDLANGRMRVPDVPTSAVYSPGPGTPSFIQNVPASATSPSFIQAPPMSAPPSSSLEPGPNSGYYTNNSGYNPPHAFAQPQSLPQVQITHPTPAASLYSIPHSNGSTTSVPPAVPRIPQRPPSLNLTPSPSYLTSDPHSSIFSGGMKPSSMSVRTAATDYSTASMGTVVLGSASREVFAVQKGVVMDGPGPASTAVSRNQSQSARSMGSGRTASERGITPPTPGSVGTFGRFPPNATSTPSNGYSGSRI